MENMKRTATCGELNKKRVGEKVCLNGWVHRKRDHGGITFINLRDRYGITQIVIDEDSKNELKEIASELRFEYCIAVTGIIRDRPNNMINPSMPTGEIEIKTEKIKILSKSNILPFMIDERTEAKEDLRYKYRYLDLRSFSMQKKIKLRHEVTSAARRYLYKKEFYEIETPTFIKATPEGARDFVVPSRILPGKFYALPQSPQLYKQLLMVSGFDKYFQIARCYRDEDARGDRQPEFTQIDIEMSFVSQEDIFELIEGLFEFIFKQTLNIQLNTPFPRITYDDAINFYGTDKPDLRFDLKLNDFDKFVNEGSFDVFKTVLKNKGKVKVLVVPGGSSFSRKMILELEEHAKTFGAKGLAWMKVVDNTKLDGGISRFYTGIHEGIIKTLNAKSGDLLLLIGSESKTACISMGAVRNQVAENIGLISKDSKQPNNYKFCWITEFPLFEWNKEKKKWDTSHHMFCMPQEKYLDNLEKNPADVKGNIFDLVCNGVELASGSLRVYDPELQERIFTLVGFSKEEAEKRFGFLLESLKYGPPPHGGIAPGLDRLVMLMSNESTIREVIAFPKNTIGMSPLDDSPSSIDPSQLKELKLEIIENKD